MRLNCLLALLSYIAFTAALTLPLNPSTGAVDDYAVPTAGDFSPGNIASDAWWDKYRNKGKHYQCLFEANDESAGRLVADARVPPSAQSVWRGSMYGE